MSDTTPVAPHDDDASGEQSAPPPLQFPTLEHFVTEFIAVIYCRPTGGPSTTWCPRWWCHDEAVFRLTALWQAWESGRLTDGPAAAAKWLTYYGDPIMRVLLNSEGAFKGCSPERGHRSERPQPEGALPVERAPEGLLTPRE